MSPPAPLWTPPADRVAASAMTRFRRRAEEVAGRPLAGSVELHRWSVDEPDAFWALLARELLTGVEVGGPAAVRGATLPEVAWFPEVRLNVAQQVLRGAPTSTDTDEMLVGVDERGRRWTRTRGTARREVAAVAAALRAAGVGPGDRVVAWMPNVVETVLVMLGAAAVGAVVATTSPDFGVDGVLDRFGQVAPTVLVAADGYTYGGRPHDRRGPLREVVAALGTLRAVVVVPFLDDAPDLDGLAPQGVEVAAWDDWLAPHRDAPEQFAPLPFDHPWYVLFTSGTTGVPKCIVHRTGGVLLQHLKEHQLHLDLRPGDRALYFTTCGWMMWNWLASTPASGVTAVLYEGSPAHPGTDRLWRLAAEERLDFLGVGAKYVDTVRQSGFEPAAEVDLRALRTMASTGSPLSPESFEWVTRHVAPGCGPDGLHLASISGGTDLCGCFVGGDPTRPVWAGELQGPALGMAVDVWREDGTPAAVGERGELVCTGVFPSMPLRFWDDPPAGGDRAPGGESAAGGGAVAGGPGPRYLGAYFERFGPPGSVWAHGDFASWTEHGGMVIHGRSDTTLNPGGVRIGTAEIYRQVDQVDGVVESLVVGLEDDGDVRVVLLVRCAVPGSLDDALVAEVRDRIRTGCTPRHVPAVVLEVDDLPRTRSGKLAELAVADAVNGRPVRNTTALANPEVLEVIAALPGLRR